MVVAYHSILTNTGGFVGVDVFFVVSGFVITRLLFAELIATDSLSFRAFYARRVRRLLPALALVLTVTAFGSLILMTPLGNLQSVARTGVASSLFAANGAMFLLTGGYFDLTAESNPLLHLWTLAVEEQFYLILPAMMLIAWRVAIRRGWPHRQTLAVLLGAIAAVSFLSSIYLSFNGGLPFHTPELNRRFAFFGSPTRAWEFCLGSLIAVFERDLAKRFGHGALSALSVVGATGIALSLVAIDPSTPFPGYAVALPVLATAALLIGGVNQGGRITGALSHRWVTWVGDQSYSWYLWHWPLIVFVKLAFPEASIWVVGAVALLGLVIAWFTGRFIEAPIRGNRQVVGMRALGVGLLCVLVPVLAFLLALVPVVHPTAAVKRLMVDAAPHLDSQHGCMANLPGSEWTRTSCTWGEVTAGGGVLLVGDSNAGQFAEPVRAIAEDEGLSLTLATFGGCPFADVTTTYVDSVRDDEGCKEFINSWKREVQHSRPRLVVVGSASTNYIYSSTVHFSSLDGASTATTVRDKAALWSEGLASLVGAWSDAGINVLVIHTVPQFSGFDLRLCPAFKVERDVADCAVTASSGLLKERSDLNQRSELAALAGLPKVATLDLFGSVCGQGATCSTFKDGQFAYRDGGHLSVPFALKLQTNIEEAVEPLLQSTPPTG